MQDLITAVIVLGRSIEDIDSYGWLCGRFGNVDGPKCVNGSMTHVMGAQTPQFVHELALERRELERPLHLASAAMVTTMPQEIRETLVENWAQTMRGESVANAEDAGNAIEAMAAPRRADLEYLGKLMTAANDLRDRDNIGPNGDPEPVLTAAGARAWFSRAIDLLAEQLPDPLPSLTVDQIVSTPIVPTRETMLGLPDDEILV